jgi:hypothetical protein
MCGVGPERFGVLPTAHGDSTLAEPLTTSFADAKAMFNKRAFGDCG